MKLPWSKLKERKKELEEELETLEKELEEVKEERDSYQERFEAEEERRKKLSREKQDVEEEINRLEDKLQSQKMREDSDAVDESQEVPGFQELEFEEARGLLQKLSTIESEEDDLVTVYSPAEVSELNGIKELKNSVPKKQFSHIQEEAGFVAFLNEEIGGYVLKTSAFFSGKVSRAESFSVSDIRDFMEKEKYWILASAGYTEIFREQNGNYEQLEVVKSRVNRDHSKGGFSQGRFERKRDEQIDSHIENAKEAVEELGLDEEKTYVLGDEKVSKEISGDYLGGFDPNRKKPGQFYKFQLKRF